MNDPRLISLSEKLNKYVALVRTENPDMSENDIVQKAAQMALVEQKTFEAKAEMVVTDVMADRFGDGTLIHDNKVKVVKFLQMDFIRKTILHLQCQKILISILQRVIEKLESLSMSCGLQKNVEIS